MKAEKIVKNAVHALFALSVATGTSAAFADGDTASADPILVRSASNGRVWQTCFAPNAPLEWHWGNAVSAQVSIVCHVERTSVSSGIVEKGGGEKMGSYALPVPASFGIDGMAYLYDASLSLFGADGRVVSSESARIAYLPGAVGAPSKLAVRSKDLEPMEGVRVVGYDAAWRDETVAAVSSHISGTYGDGSAADIALNGTSGYEPLAADAVCKNGVASLSLDFSTLSSAWTASLHAPFGFILTFR